MHVVHQFHYFWHASITPGHFQNYAKGKTCIMKYIIQDMLHLHITLNSEASTSSK
jgi:hypothetical protein